MDSSITHLSVLNRMIEEFKTVENRTYEDTFYFGFMLSEFGLKISEEQSKKMLSILTQEQIEAINRKLDEKQTWF